MKMKKMLSFVLAVLMLLQITGPYKAVHTDKNFKNSSNATVLYQDSFEDVFGPGSVYRAETIEPSVSYEYTFVPNKEGTSAEVQLNFTLHYATYDYAASASGIVDSVKMADGTILWEGPLDGTIDINDNPHKIIVGFAKIEGNSDIQFSVNVIVEASQTSPLILFCGTNVLKDLDIDELKAFDESKTSIDDSNSDDNNIDLFAVSDRYIRECDATAKFSSNSTKTGQRTRVYCNSARNTVAVSINSYTATLNAALNKDMLHVSSTVEKFSIGLERTSTTAANNSWIGGTESFDFDVSNYNSNREVVLLPLFYDILNKLNVPTNIINLMFETTSGNLKGSVSRTVYTNKAEVSVKFGATQPAAFDNDSYPGATIVFQLDRAATGYTGPSPYKATTSLRYRTLCVDIYDATYYVYTDTNPLTCSFNIALS